MKSTTLGLVIAFIAAVTFGLSGAFIKPLLESGWSPAAAVTVRVLIGGLVLLPFALFAMRGKWVLLWIGRWRVLGMALVGVAGTQLVYFAAVERIPVGTAILLEYLAPLLLVGVAWIATRKVPKVVVLIGSVVAVVGLFMVVSPGGGGVLDPIGLLYGFLAAIGCAIYYVIAARPSKGLPPIALAAAGLLLGAFVLGIVGLLRLVPFRAPMVDVPLLGSVVPWWVPMLVVGVFATAIAYAASITAGAMLGSRLASFMGLLEVVAGTLFAWILLGENLTVPQLLGGVLILAGIAFVRSEKATPEAQLAENPVTESVEAAEPVEVREPVVDSRP